MTGQLPSVSGLRTRVTGPSKAQPLCTKLIGVNLLSVQYKKGGESRCKNFGTTRGFGHIHIYIPVHLFCIPRLQSVHSVDILHTKL